MAIKKEHIHQPKTRELPKATPDVFGILFHSFEKGLLPEQAVEECTKAGAPYVTPKQAVEHYGDLTKLKEKWILPAEEYLKQRRASGPKD